MLDTYLESTMFRTKEELLNTPRMEFDTLNEGNLCVGLQDLIDMCVTTESIVVEIGSYAGVSSELFAKHCKRLYCIDPWDLFTDEPGFVPNLIQAETRFNEMAMNYPNIIKIKDFSVHAALTYKFKEKPDLVYIDGKHDRYSVRCDIGIWFNIVKRGGWITGHDINIHGVMESVELMLGSDYHIFKDNSWAWKKI